MKLRTTAATAWQLVARDVFFDDCWCVRMPLSTDRHSATPGGSSLFVPRERESLSSLFCSARSPRSSRCFLREAKRRSAVHAPLRRVWLHVMGTRHGQAELNYRAVCGATQQVLEECCREAKGAARTPRAARVRLPSQAQSARVSEADVRGNI